jgi:hypothetical protein
MKLLTHLLMCSLLLSMLIACGKDNESGRMTAPIPVPNPYVVPNPYAPVNTTPYAFQGVNVDQVLAQNPCVNGFAGHASPQPYTNHRTTVQVQLTGFKTVVAPGDIYVGVTSYGDVATVAGQAVGQPPVFMGYLCPRPNVPAGTGQLLGVEVGANTPRCLFKPITKATVIFPGGMTAEFRWLDGGNSNRQPFLPPVCLPQ